MSFPNLENKRILIVEDDEMSFLYLKQLLILTRCTFMRENTGIDAIQHFRNNGQYDLILMDIQLPDMDGKQVTQEIRLLNNRIPIIAQTASRSLIERDLIIEAGCSAIITKPFSMEELYDVVVRYLNKF